MNTEEIVKGGALETTETTETTETAAPAITNDEYAELAGLRASQNELKLRGWDLQEFVKNGEAQLAEARKQLDEVREKLEETTVTLQTRFEAVIAPHGFTGSVTISDEVPHVITQN